jgi:hypothetical protein
VDDNTPQVFSASGEFKRKLVLDYAEFGRVSSFKVSDAWLAVGDSYSKIKIFGLSDGRLRCFIREPFDCFCVQDSSLVLLNANGELQFYELPPAYTGDEYSQNCDRSKLVHLTKQAVMRNESCFNFDSNSVLYFNRKLVICFPWKKRLCILS